MKTDRILNFIITVSVLLTLLSLIGTLMITFSETVTGSLLNVIAAVKNSPIKHDIWRHNLITGGFQIFTFLFTATLIFIISRVRSKIRIGSGGFKIFAAIVFFIIAITAFIARLVFGILPYGIADGYISLLMDYSSTGSLIVSSGRSVFYPLFLLGAGLISGSFVFICILQAIIGVFTGVILWHLWNATLSFYNNPSDKFIYYHKITGLFLSILFLFNTAKIDLEHRLNPEFFTMFLITAILFFAYRLLIKFTLTDLSLLIAANLLTIGVQPKWLLAGLFTISAAVIICLIKNRDLRNIIKVVSVTILTSLFCLGMGALLNKTIKQSPEGNAFRSSSMLFITHYTIINAALEEDLRSNNIKYAPEILKDFSDFYKKHKSSFHGKKLLYTSSPGFNTIAHSKEYSLFIEEIKQKYPEINISSFLKHYFIRGILKKPLSYTDKIIYELSYHYMPIKGFAYKQRQKFNQKEIYSKVLSGIDRYSKSPLKSSYRSQLEETIPRSKTIYPLNFMALIYKAGSFLNPFIIILTLSVLIYDMIKKRLSDKKIAAVIVLINIQIFLTFLLTSMIYILHLDRYVNEMFPLVLFGEFIMGEYVLLRMLNIFKKYKTNGHF